MNELDYRILEFLLIVNGFITSIIMLWLTFVSNLDFIFDILFLITIPSFIGVISSIFVEIKRHEYVNEMLSYLKVFKNGKN